MLIKILHSAVGPVEEYFAGNEYEVSADRAGQLISAGYAVDVTPKVERAVKAPAKETR